VGHVSTAPWLDSRKSRPDSFGGCRMPTRKPAGRSRSVGTTPVQLPDADQRKRAAADRLAAVPMQGQAAELDVLRAGTDHPAPCPSLRVLLQAALALPSPNRVLAMHTVL
jgi:hypothetical protein